MKGHMTRPARRYGLLTLLLCLLAMAWIMVHASVAHAKAEEIHVEHVPLTAGSARATLQGQIHGYEIIDYKVAAQAGQTMIVNMSTNSGANYFNLMAPGEMEVAFFNGSLNDNSYIGRVQQSGEQTIRVYQMRSAARRNETANFTLNVEIAPADYADSLSGGPDFWQVSTATPTGRVNLREAPSLKARVIDRLYGDTVLRNKGCRISEGRRWCSVEQPDNPNARGWLVGDYLRESGYIEPQLQVDALVPGTEFHATGSLPCARNAEKPMWRCQFGVVREGNGFGYVKIFWPDAGTQVIFFEEGTPMSFDDDKADGGAALTVDKDADLFIIHIGKQRFEIPDAVIWGG